MGEFLENRHEKSSFVVFINSGEVVACFTRRAEWLYLMMERFLPVVI